MKKSFTDEVVAIDTTDLRVGIVVSTYHDFVTGPLRDGAMAALTHVGVSEKTVVVVEVPGAFEIPFAARQAAESGVFDLIVCLGCLIRGETPHFDYISSAVAHGIMTASQVTGVPMSFGVLTTNSREEAVARSGLGSTNKGWESAIAAIHMVDVARRLHQMGSTKADR